MLQLMYQNRYFRSADLKLKVKDMKETLNLNQLFKKIKHLNEVEQTAIAEEIMKLLKKPKSLKVGTCHELIDISNDIKPDCPHCGAKANVGWLFKR